MKLRLPASLFGRNAVTLLAAFLAFQVFTVATVVYFVLLPLAERSADDLAELIVLSAQTWVELPPQTRPDFEDELARHHDLWLSAEATPMAPSAKVAPYQQLLERALTRRAGHAVPVVLSDWAQPWLWTEIRVAGQWLRIGFPKDRIGTRPILALFLVLGAGTLLALVTALILARRIGAPLARFGAAAHSVGKGEAAQLLAESGPRELAELARTFNRMAIQVRELLSNRTVLLAGISHDLRTPLARMRLAVEMLPADADPQLVGQLRRDVELMNEMIGTLLDLSRGLSSEERRSLDLGELLKQLVGEREDCGVLLKVCEGPPCRVLAAPLALRRILANLLDNAIRYGDGKPVEIAWFDGAASGVSILDHGPGIPAAAREAVFQPFYRLEASRSKATGGSGLGLAIARQLAQSQGWRVELLARPEGGTEARLTLREDAGAAAKA